LVVKNDSIVIGSGTTTFEFVRYLHPQKPLTVITSAIKVALKLCKRSNIDVLQLRHHTFQFFFSNRRLSTTNLGETTSSKQMIKAAQIRAVMADSTKFNRCGLSKICRLEHM